MADEAENDYIGAEPEDFDDITLDAPSRRRPSSGDGPAASTFKGTRSRSTRRAKEDLSADDDADDAGRVYVTDEEVAALTEEHRIMSESLEDLGKRMLAEALPKAILMIVKLAESGATDTTRLNAAKYLIDRNLGPVSTAANEISKAPWEKILDDVTVTIPATEG